MKKVLLTLIFSIVAFCSFSQVVEIERELRTESDGFRWYKLRKQVGHLYFYSAQDLNRNTIIPFVNGVMYDDGYFKVERYVDDVPKEGLYYKDGSEVIPMSTNYRGFMVYKEGEETYATVSDRKLESESLFKLNTTNYKLLIPFGKYKSIFPVSDADGVWFEVRKKDYKDYKHGACDENGNEIVAPIYDGLRYNDTKHSFVSVKKVGGNEIETPLNIDLRRNRNSLQLQSGGNSTSTSSAIWDFAYGSHYVIKELETEGIAIPFEGDFCIIENYGMMLVLGDGDGNAERMLPYTGLRLLERKVQEDSIDYYFIDGNGVVIGLRMTNQEFILIIKDSDKTNMFSGQNRKYDSPTLRMK